MALFAAGFAAVGTATRADLSQPSPVPVGLSARATLTLSADHDALVGRLNQLAADIAQQNGQCGHVADDDTAKIADCERSRADIQTRIDAYKPALATYEQALLAAEREPVVEHNTVAKIPEAIAAKKPDLVARRAELLRSQNSASVEDFNKQIRELKADCVSFSSVSFWLALNQCQRQRTIYSCFHGAGVSEKSLACVATLPATGTPAFLAACGLAATAPLDVGRRCLDLNDTCLTNALKIQKAKTAACLR